MCHISQCVNKFTFNLYRKNAINMKNSLLKNGNMPRRCWLPSYAFSLKDCQVVQETRKGEDAHLSFVYCRTGKEELLFASRRSDDAKKKRKRRMYVKKRKKTCMPFVFCSTNQFAVERSQCECKDLIIRIEDGVKYIYIYRRKWASIEECVGGQAVGRNEKLKIDDIKIFLLATHNHDII